MRPVDRAIVEPGATPPGRPIGAIGSAYARGSPKGADKQKPRKETTMFALVAVAALFIGGAAAGFESGQANPEASNFFDNVQQLNSAE